ncbi:hypothetical protein ACFTAO_03525 [Paenibacillus rhizoplanae]
MTIIRAVTLRNIMIILCILMLLPLGQKALGIKNKLQDVQEAGKIVCCRGAYRCREPVPPSSGQSRDIL